MVDTVGGKWSGRENGSVQASFQQLSEKTLEKWLIARLDNMGDSLVSNMKIMLLNLSLRNG